MSLGIKCIICILHIIENALKYPSFWRWPEMKYEMIRKFHNKARRYQADMSQQSEGGGGGWTFWKGMLFFFHKQQGCKSFLQP